jgi:hypothetical protein
MQPGGLGDEREVCSGVANLQAVEGFTGFGQGFVMARTGERIDVYQ